MPDENRVFDVTKPKYVSPDATSKPVIVGHHPVMSDPMVKEDSSSSAMKIHVNDNSPDNSFLVGPSDPAAAEPAAEQFQHIKPVMPLEHHDEAEKEPEDHAAFKISPEDEEKQPADVETTSPEETSPFTSAAEPAPASNPFADNAPAPNTEIHPLPSADDGPPAQANSHIEGLHFPQKKKSGKGLKWFILALLVILIGAYAAVDSGAVGSGINLPVHIFKKKTNNTPAPAAQTPAAQTPAKSSAPAGFKEYKIAGTGLTFAAPVAWGDPVSVTEAGYSTRGGSSQTAGTYAYLVEFAANKDVQIAVTSAKYLPPARATLYYDYLQWCTGTVDGKYYASVLHFNTVDKVDTPTTAACDQGPIAGALKLDSSTIEQPKAQSPANTVIGDIYTKNLNDPALAVFRVKDAAMTNGAAIKLLLSTVKISPAAASANQ